MTWTNLDNATLYRVRKLRKTAEALGLRLERHTSDPAGQEFAYDVLDDKSKDIVVLMCSLDVAEAAILAERADRHLKAYDADMTRVNALGGLGALLVASDFHEPH